MWSGQNPEEDLEKGGRHGGGGQRGLRAFFKSCSPSLLISVSRIWPCLFLIDSAATLLFLLPNSFLGLYV